MGLALCTQWLSSLRVQPCSLELAMLGVDLKAFLRPNEELHLRVEARFLGKPANGLLWCPRQFGTFSLGV